jgi:aldose sugar dehydrogenase
MKPAGCCALRLSAAGSALVLACSMAACDSRGMPPAPPGTAPPLQATLLDARLASPWGLAFLPDGRMLITQRRGSMVIVRADGSAVDTPLSGVPAVYSGGQGGLLDVAIDPDFATDPWIYFSYSEAGSGGAGTAVARARLRGDTLRDLAVIWRQTPKLASNIHYGSRIVFRADKTLYVTVGERGQDDPAEPTRQYAQDVSTALGKVLRLHRDGGIPADNPRFEDAGATALPGLWSLGHRNPQGAALRPGNDELWITEHGPRGGDELNRVLPGRNYGWPLTSWGCPYSFAISEPACRPGGGVHAPQFEEPKTTWLPTSTGPSGLAFYNGQRFPEWQGHLFAGSLLDRTLWHIVLDANGAVTSRTAVQAVSALHRRIRSVTPGPDGWLYLLTDDGRIVRLER